MGFGALGRAGEWREVRWEGEKTLRLNSCIILNKFWGKKYSACAFQPDEARAATEKGKSRKGKF